jgi:hypothetical protein
VLCAFEQPDPAAHENGDDVDLELVQQSALRYC